MAATTVCECLGENVQLYCKACKALCCSLCEKSAHKGHDVVPREEAAADIGSGLQDDVGRLQASLQVAGREAQFAQTAEAARKAIDELRASHATVSGRLASYFAELRAAVEAKERELQAQLKEKFEPALATFETQLADASSSLPNAREALEAGERAASLEVGDALGAWRAVRSAIAANERCAATVVEPVMVMWEGSPKEVCDAIARVDSVSASEGPLPGISFRDGPKYSVSGPHRNVVTKTDAYSGNFDTTAVGERALPKGRKTRWAVKIVRSASGNLMIGVAPPTINQAGINSHSSCGWYLYAAISKLMSGRPHNCSGKQCGQLSGRIADGSIVEVEADTHTGTLSFSVNGKTSGIAYEGLPADLVPVVLLTNKGDSFEVIWP